MSDGPWPNPVLTTSVGTNFFNFAGNWELNVRESIPGDIGNLKYYPYLNGPFKESATATVRFGRVYDSWQQYKTWYAAYEAQVPAYNTLKDAYNAELKKEKLRQTSPFSIFG